MIKKEMNMSFVFLKHVLLVCIGKTAVKLSDAVLAALLVTMSTRLVVMVARKGAWEAIAIHTRVLKGYVDFRNNSNGKSLCRIVQSLLSD